VNNTISKDAVVYGNSTVSVLRIKVN